jgi:hypothetical protein
MTPTVLVSIPALFVFPYIYLVLFGREESCYADIYCACCNTVAIALPALVYRWIKLPPLGWSGSGPASRWAHWIALAFAELTFAPILIEFRNYLLDPRHIYQETRRGYGLPFFGSAVLLNVAATLFFFRKSKNRGADFLFWIIVGASTLEHGSKGELLSFLWIWILFRIYVDRRPFKLLESARVIVVLGVVLATSFIAFGIAEPAELIQGVSKYADYTRTASHVIDDPDRPVYFGLLTLEDNIYSRIPRAFFPEKPKVFGVFRLTMRYFSASDWEDVGSPDFGIGIPYADFGPFAILYIAAFAFFTGISASCLVRKLKTDPNPGNLLLLAFFAGVSLIPTGIGYSLPETALLSWLVLKASRFPAIRFVGRSRSATLDNPRKENAIIEIS